MSIYLCYLLLFVVYIVTKLLLTIESSCEFAFACHVAIKSAAVLLTESLFPVLRRQGH